MGAACSQVVQAPDASPAAGSLSAGKASALPGDSRLVRSLMQVSGTAAVALEGLVQAATMSKLLWYSATVLKHQPYRQHSKHSFATVRKRRSGSFGTGL